MTMGKYSPRHMTNLIDELESTIEILENPGAHYLEDGEMEKVNEIIDYCKYIIDNFSKKEESEALSIKFTDEEGENTLKNLKKIFKRYNQ